MELAVQIAGLITSIATLSALVVFFLQFKVMTNTHVSGLHLEIFKKLDDPEIRESRHFVYAMDGERQPRDMNGLTFQNEHWLQLDKADFDMASELERRQWTENKKKAERIARTLDQLGYLVREGIVPMSLVAHFYSHPTLKCWYIMMPYIAAVRHDRKQPGHMWEWQHLVEHIIDGVIKNDGIWEGAGAHDHLDKLAVAIKDRKRAIRDFPEDDNWTPKERIRDRW